MVELSDGFELFDNRIELFTERVELREFNVQLTAPQFTLGAFGERLAKRVDFLTSSVPSFVAAVDGDAVVDEPSSDRALDFVDALVE